MTPLQFPISEYSRYVADLRIHRYSVQYKEQATLRYYVRHATLPGFSVILQGRCWYTCTPTHQPLSIGALATIELKIGHVTQGPRQDVLVVKSCSTAWN